MAHSGFLISILALTLLQALVTPTWGNPVEHRNSKIPINFYYPDLQNGTLDQPYPRWIYPKQCSAECGIRGGSGRSNHDEKIVGGEDAEKDEFPWRCLLRAADSEGRWGRCGCTVLSENWILTAAHCTYGSKNVEVYAGFLDARKMRSGDYQSGPVAEVINHESYNPKTMDNDIALVKVNKPIRFSSSIQPACLPYHLRNYNVFRNGTVTASGWGKLYSGAESSPTIMQKLDNLPLITRRQCRQYYKGRVEITDNMMCTYEAGIDTCQGDSGGSIDFLDKDGRYKSIGIVSFGVGCAKKGNPGVYAEVSNYLMWIGEQTVSFLALALPLASATPTLGDSVQPTGQNTAVEYFGFSLENSTFDEPIPLQSFRSECSTRCGRRGSSRAASHDEKIVGGKNANKDEFPWRCMVTFKENGVPQMCGCTVLSQNWILTAAHCTHRMTDVRVFAGFLDKRNTRNAPYQSGADTRVINHRSYNPDTNDNDISLIRVNRPITFSSSIQPACLPYGMRSSDLRRATVTASGWGDRYYDDKNPPNILQKLDNLPLISRQQCQRYYNGRAKITENMICTYEAGIDTCQGDSGGSIDYLDRDGRYKSIGVVSFGHGCAGKDNPGVYADVSKYLRWISDQTGSTFCGQSE